MKEIWQKLYIINNFIDIDSSLDLHIVQEVVNFILDIGHRIDVTYYGNLKSLFVIIGNNGEYEAMIKMEKLLVEE